LEPREQLVDWATPWSRTAENFDNATGLQGYPGGKFFHPLCLVGEVKGREYVPDYSKLSRLQVAEIKHARIAMVALLIFYFKAGKGFTSLGALGLYINLVHYVAAVESELDRFFEKPTSAISTSATE
jgi:light-harvesting complex II chlorophyll a/b binding protein 6